MVNRVPSQEIVDAAPIVIDEGDPDLLFLNAKKVIVIKDGKTIYDKYSVGTPGIGGDSGGNPPVDPNPPTPPPVEVIRQDIPNLGDIESIVYQQYYDSSKKARIRAVIKIRNSSLKPQEVVGVDARVYDPS